MNENRDYRQCGKYELLLEVYRLNALIASVQLLHATSAESTRLHQKEMDHWMSKRLDLLQSISSPLPNGQGIEITLNESDSREIMRLKKEGKVGVFQVRLTDTDIEDILRLRDEANG